MIAVTFALLASCVSVNAFVVRQNMRMTFDLERAVDTLSRNKILTKTSQLGLLSKLEKAGFSLTTAKPLLVLADDLDLLGVLDAESDKVLPLVGKAVELAPQLLPLAGSALGIPFTALYGGAAASLAAAAGIIALVPDDSVGSIAVQTFAAITFGAVLPGALGVGGFILSKIGGSSVKIAPPVKASAPVLAAPKAAFTAPKLPFSAPKVVAAASPKVVAAAPKVVAAAPKVVAAAAPKVVAATPKVVAAAPKVVAVTPKVVAAAPKVVAAAPKVVAATPKVVAVAAGGSKNGKRKTIKL